METKGMLEVNVWKHLKEISIQQREQGGRTAQLLTAHTQNLTQFIPILHEGYVPCERPSRLKSD